MELKVAKKNIKIDMEAIGGCYRELSGSSASSINFIGKNDSEIQLESY